MTELVENVLAVPINYGQFLFSSTEALIALSGRLNEAAKLVTSIEKRGFNAFHKYNYVTSEDVKREVGAALSAQELTIIPSVLERYCEGDKTIIKWLFTIVGPEGYLQTVWVSEASDTQDKGTAKAATSGMKYFFINLLQIPTGDEPDTDSEGSAKPKEKPQDISKMTLVEARAITTQQGTPFSELEDDQLQWILDNPEKASPRKIKAAELVMGERVK